VHENVIIGWTVGVGCAVILGIVIAFIIVHMRRRKHLYKQENELVLHKFLYFMKFLFFIFVISSFFMRCNNCLHLVCIAQIHDQIVI